MNHTYKDTPYCNTNFRLNKEIDQVSTSYDDSRQRKVFQSVSKMIKKTRCFENVKRVMVGISGGVDSSVLLHILCLYRDHENGPQVLALHVNHGQRDTSFIDQKSAGELAEKYGCEFHVEYLENVERNLSEDDLRKRRYEKMMSFAKLHQLERVVLAHHQDDQVETFLFRLFRGADISGLSAMKQFQAPYVRPFLKVRHRDLIREAEESGIRYVDDPSNSFTGPARNFIRRNLLPSIQTKLDPQVVEHLSDLTHSLREIDEYITAQAIDMIQKVKVSNHVYNVRKIQIIPSVLRKKMIQQMFRYIIEDGKGSLSRDHVEMIDRWMESTQSPKHLLLPLHVRVEKSKSVLTFSKT